MEQINWKRVISVFFALVAFGFTFFALSFRILKCSVISFDIIKVSGFYLIIGKESFFDLECGEWVHIFTKAMFIFMIALIGVPHVLQKDRSSDQIVELLLLLFVGLTFVYMINGFMVVDQMKELVEKELDVLQTDPYWEYYDVDLEELGELYEIKTLAWIPFLVVSVSVAVYFVLEYLVKETPIVQKKKDAMIYEKFSFGEQETENRKDFMVVTEENNTQMLLKYKQLLDEGVITKEEFDRKKQQLLW